MGHGHAGLGHELAHSSSRRLDVRDPVVHEEDLALAQQLAADRLDHGRFVELPDVVRIGRRSAGGVLTIERSRMPVRAISRVRGIGLARQREDVDPDRTAP